MSNAVLITLNMAFTILTFVPVMLKVEPIHAMVIPADHSFAIKEGLKILMSYLMKL